MQTIDDLIRNVDGVICRYLDGMENSSRGEKSQDILGQLTKLVNLIMLKFYARNKEIPVTDDNIEKAAEHAQITSDLSDMYRFRKFLKSVADQITLNEDGSERLMLKYYQYLLEAKNLLSRTYGMEILHNLEKFPLHLDSTLQEYYGKIAEKIEKYPVKYRGEKNKYYIQKIKPLFIGTKIYHEITFAPADDSNNRTKSNRSIAFTKLPINKRYASKFHLIQETIDILGKTMPITIIDGWEVSIRDCEFKNFASLINGQIYNVPYKEKSVICHSLTVKNYTLNELMDFPDYAYRRITAEWRDTAKSEIFISVLDYCRNIIQSESPGQNILRYLLYSMNNVIIKNQRGDISNRNLSNLYLANGCKPFDSLPFNRSPLHHNPRAGAVFECIPHENRQPELFARFIRNNTETKGQLFTDINSITAYKDVPSLIKNYNGSLWSGHRPESDLMLEYNHVFINEYKIDTCTIIEKLRELAYSGVEGYEFDVDFWQFCSDYIIDCKEKKDLIDRLFAKSRVGVIYGSAGVGKSTMINHVSHFMNDKEKLYLTQTNPAKENLMRRIDAQKTYFSTIDSFLRSESAVTEYDLVVIDECSTVSNRDMVAVLEKAKFDVLLLAGDPYQIDAIQFGNWFSVLKYFLPQYAIFELTSPYRTKDTHLLELWNKVRRMDDDVKEYIERDRRSLKVDDSLFSPAKEDEAILCLNYDGLYGINNINRFLQECNTNPAVGWDDVQQYKVGDPILFLDSDRFRPVLYNNLKGIIRGVEIIDAGTDKERIQFDIEVPKEITSNDVTFKDIWIVYSDEWNSLIRFYVYKSKDSDKDDDALTARTKIPFQLAYAVSIHKAQGLEFNSVKLVITDEVEEQITHNVFYTAITRAKKELKIYWTPEVEEKILKRLKPRDISKDVEILKKYLN